MNKILIIEDDPAIRLGVEEYLSSHGYSVIKSADGKEGLEIALEVNPDLILLDINLPSLNGIEVFRKLKEKQFRKPIIMLTSMTDTVDKVVGWELGVDDYVTKPFEFRELLSRIRNKIIRFEESSSSELKSEAKTEIDRAVVDKTVIQENNINTLQRHLLAIMFSDMVEYSKKMSENEKLTLVHLKAHNQIIENTVSKFKGKVIEITGDGFLASFESATNALKCCIEIQNQIKEYNIDKSEQDSVKIRIGLHLGDVVEFEGKIKGNSLNIAKRIQEKAEPESIYLSEIFYLTVKGKTGTDFIKLGTFELKNIKERIEIYKVIL